MELSIIIIILIGYLFTVLISVNNKNYIKKTNINSNYFRIITCNYIFAMIYLFLFIYFFKNIIFNNSDTNILLEIGKSILYLLIIDFLFYWYHRTVHRNKILKKNFHDLHHEYYSIPSDSLYISVCELFTTITLIFVPSLFLNIRLETFIIILSLYYIHQLYIHSESTLDISILISSKFHEDHHKIGGGNYSVVFPFLDSLLNTQCKI